MLRGSAPAMTRLLPALAALLLAAVAVADDGATLLEIKKSFRNGDNALHDWSGEGASPGYCSWRGVLCDNVTFAVAALNLSGLNLEGEISAAIGRLKSVVSIDFKSNGLSGQIPDEIGDCSLLETLDLSSNNLEGDVPFSISKLKHLENL
uniref:Leucine-rich repeat-containing N-terminal plant-type domain-containing protein n=1 Tax=Arundo donax TaxID=35708 RepID=A0A0A9AF61_ARUDO